jgi:hypothetical protein
MKREMMNMINLYFRCSLGRTRSAMVTVVILAIGATGGAHLGIAQQSASTAFSSAKEATQALFQSVQSNNLEAIASILGGPSELASSGDAAKDALDRGMFIEKYQVMHRLGRDADGSETLYIGAENWPFPIPLVEKNGAWRFDADSGMKEVLFRRIGENELTAIMICHELVAAEKQLRANQNAASQVESALASLVSSAAGGSATVGPVLFHGYYFRVAAKPRADGKAAGFIAYPAQYRSSGVMTFIVSENDIVKEKDLGANTSAVAKAMEGSPKEKGWVSSEGK